MKVGEWGQELDQFEDIASIQPDYRDAQALLTQIRQKLMETKNPGQKRSLSWQQGLLYNAGISVALGTVSVAILLSILSPYVVATPSATAQPSPTSAVATPSASAQPSPTAILTPAWQDFTISFVPYGVAVDSQGNIYMADYGGGRGNGRIQKLSPSGQPLAQWGYRGSGSGQFSSPWGVTLDSQGNIYVADSNNSRIQKLSRTTMGAASVQQVGLVATSAPA
jgi:hypothetical protein